MSHDGLPVRADSARGAAADRPVITNRRRHLSSIAALAAVTALALAACGNSAGSAAPAASGSTTSAAPASSEMPSAAASTDASTAPSAAPATQGRLSFQDANGSKIFGGGILTDLGDGSSAVTIGVVAIGFTDPMPAEIVAGDCATIIAAPAPSAGTASPSAAATAAPSVAASVEPSAAASVAPTPATLPVTLTDVAAGSSNTVVQIGLADLLATPTAVVIHKSAADATVVACAPVVAAPMASPSDMPSSMPADSSAMPSGSTAP